MKTILFLLALAAAPVSFAQVARPVMPGGSALYAPMPHTVTGNDQAVYLAVYTNFGQVVARIDAQREITQGSRLFPPVFGDIWPPSVSVALGRVFYTLAGALRSSDGTSQDDHAVPGAALFASAVVEAHGWAYFAAPVPAGGQILLQRTDGFAVDAFSAALPGTLAGMWAVNNLVVVATRNPGFALHAIDAAGVVTGLYAGTAAQKGAFLGLLGDGLVFSDHVGGLTRLMFTNGTPLGTHPVADMNVPAEPRDGMTHGGTVFFLLQGAAGFDEAWLTNGTPTGTRRLSTWDADGVVSGKGAVLGGSVYFTTTASARHSLWRVGPGQAGALRVFHSEPQPYYAALEFAAGGRIYLRTTDGQLRRSDLSLLNFEPANIVFAGDADAELNRVFGIMGGTALVTDQQHRLWTVDFSEPREGREEESGCTAGAARGWLPAAVAWVAAVAILRRRELFARRRAGQHNHPAGERRPAPRELP